LTAIFNTQLPLNQQFEGSRNMSEFAQPITHYGASNGGMSGRDTVGAFSDSHESGYDHQSDDGAESPTPRGYQNGSQRHPQQQQQYADYGQPTAAGPPAVRTQQSQQGIAGSSSVGGLSGMVRKKLGNFVGFANLPDQVHRRSVRSVQSCCGEILHWKPLV